MERSAVRSIDGWIGLFGIVSPCRED